MSTGYDYDWPPSLPDEEVPGPLFTPALQHVGKVLVAGVRAVLGLRGDKTPVLPAPTVAGHHAQAPWMQPGSGMMCTTGGPHIDDNEDDDEWFGMSTASGPLKQFHVHTLSAGSQLQPQAQAKLHVAPAVPTNPRTISLNGLTARQEEKP